MEHKHTVIDSDTRFSINSTTRQIRNDSNKKIVLIQNDHRSERFTFELDKVVEGHPMDQCNQVEVHFLNIASNKKSQKSGLYTVDDFRAEDDKVVCSWLIDRNATGLVGSLNFLLVFKCVESGVITYAWHTAIYTGISISDGINADESFETDYVDVIERWKAKVMAHFTADLATWKTETAKAVREEAFEDIATERKRIDLLSNYVTPQMFGAKGDGVTDDTDAFRDMIDYAYENGVLSETWRCGTKIYVPNGEYVITSSLIDANNAVAGRFTFEGESQHGVRLLVSADVLFDNYDVFGFTTFKNLTLVGSDTTFMDFYSHHRGIAQGLIFEKCEFNNFHTILDCSGGIMCSEVTFRDCKIRQCGSVENLCELFVIDNTQAVNWRFYATDIESFRGVAFMYLQGANVNIYQGSIIPIGNNSVIISVPAEANVDTFGGGNAPHMNMDGVRFELRNNSLLCDFKCFQSMFVGRFTGCGMGGANLAEGVKPLVAVNSGFVLTFEGCRNMVNYCGDFSFNTNYNFSKSSVKFDNCDMNEEDFVDNTTLAVAGANYGWLPAFVFNGRRYGMGYVSVSNVAEKRISLIDWTLGNGFYLQYGTTHCAVSVLIDAFVKSFNVDTIRNLTAYGTETFTIAFSDDGGSIGTITDRIQGIKSETLAVNKYIKYVTIETSSSYSGTTHAPLFVSADILA